MYIVVVLYASVTPLLLNLIVLFVCLVLAASITIYSWWYVHTSIHTHIHTMYDMCMQYYMPYKFGWRFDARKCKVKPLGASQSLSYNFPCTGYKGFSLKGTALRGNHVARIGIWAHQVHSYYYILIAIINDSYYYILIAIIIY